MLYEKKSRVPLKAAFSKRGGFLIFTTFDLSRHARLCLLFSGPKTKRDHECAISERFVHINLHFGLHHLAYNIWFHVFFMRGKLACVHHTQRLGFLGFGCISRDILMQNIFLPHGM